MTFLSKITLLTFSVLFCMANLCLSAERAAPEFNITLLGDEKLSVLPLVIQGPAKVTKQVFLSYFRGVLLESVIVDGGENIARESNAYVDEDAVQPTEVIEMGYYIYRVSTTEPMYFAGVGGADDLEKRPQRVIWPNKFNTVVIEYRGRYADGSKTCLHRLIIRRQVESKRKTS